jgi:hypothetical protein
MVNEFGEKISKREEDLIVRRIQNLSLKDMDKFFYNCGWIDIDPGKNKSLPDWRLREIKGNSIGLRIFLKHFLQETKKQDILDNLKKFF